MQRTVEILRGRVGHYVFISSTVIYAASKLLPIHEDMPLERGPAQNGYGAGKIACEELLVREHRERGFPATVVCLSMVFGPNNILPDREQRMFRRLIEGRPILIPGDGTTLGQVGFVDDQAGALRCLMGQPVSFGKRYNLTGSDAFSSEGYVDVFAEVLGRPAQKVFVPPAHMDALYDGEVQLDGSPPELRGDAAARTGRRDHQPFLLSMLVQRLAPNIHRWSDNVVFGIDRLRRDVGWEPQVRFPVAVEETWRWFRDTGLAESKRFDFDWEDQILAGLPR